MADTDLLPCPFCGKAMMLRGALWPSEGDRDAVIHAEPTDCPMYDFANDTFDGSIVEVWNHRAPSPSPAPGVVEALRECLKRLEIEHGDYEPQDIRCLTCRAITQGRTALASLSQPTKGERAGGGL